jgi:centrosomal protein CEP104
MTQQLTKITFKVVGCTSWEDGYHPKSLEHIHPFVEGWRSERYCLYPQQIVLYLPPPAKSKIQKIQILSHEFLIASKIELYIGTLPQTGLCTSYELNNVTYKRLGYVSLSENVTTSHKSREMKSVNVDVIGQYVKLVFYSNHINQFNLYSQVSIIGLNLLGHRNFQPSLISDQPNLMYYNYSNITGAKPNSLCVSQTDDLLFQFSIDIETAEIIKKLTEKKNEAITSIYHI